MGGGEDDQKELERLGRDLAAIDARWNSEGYQQRTSSQVLDDERATRRELQLQLMKLETRIKSSAATPALGIGSVRANVGAGWQPLAIYESVAPAVQPSALPLAPLATTGPAPALDLEVLREKLFDIAIRDWRGTPWHGPYDAISALVPQWRDVPGAARLLSAAFWSMGAEHSAELLGPPPNFRTALGPMHLRSPMLTGATAAPDAFTGLTRLETQVLSALRTSAPETGPFVPLASLLAEARVVVPELTEDEFVRILARSGHPSLRTFPLVAFQGFSGKFDPQPTFTHARLTPVGREVLDGRFPLPMLLVNGAEGIQTCALQYHPLDVCTACLETLETPLRAWSEMRVGGFDLPSGAMTSMHDATVMWTLPAGTVSVFPVVQTEVSWASLKARVVVTGFPWPMSALDAAERVETARREGCLEGVTNVLSESSADQQRLVLELEHVVFAKATVRFLANTHAIAGCYPVNYRCLDGGEFTPRRIVILFLDERKRAAALAIDRRVGAARIRAQEQEAVCVALEILDRVQGVTRDALTDAEAVSGLINFMRPEDRAALEGLPFALSHDYASGFTLDQARYLVKQRRLSSRPKEAAHTDWARALNELREAQSQTQNSAELKDVVRRELLAARERFAEFPRRSLSR
ncbi:MAG: DNA gyrase subunit A [Archangium sp.]